MARGAQPYRVEFRPSAEAQLTKLPPSVRRRIVARIENLADNPRPRGAAKLEGVQDLYRIRIGDYRVIYQVRDDLLLVLVLRIGHRREIYRNL